MSLTFVELSDAIEKYVEKSLEDYSHIKIKSPKAIHDSILETNYFQPYEIAFIDLPIVQRLRRISQTDVAYFIFPSGNHNRFEHTLGVTTITGRFVDALYQKNSSLLKEIGKDKNYVYHNCRIAAILHDVGHGPFSHLTEQVYDSLLNKIVKEEKIFQGASSHEILSYLIVTSKAMQKFNNEIIKKLYNIDIDLKLVGDIIIGYSQDKKSEVFMVEIINGAFDADKLDYMLRDAHSTGIRMSLDLSRLLCTIDVIKRDDKIRLSIDITGAIALEQIVFNKMTLFTTIYHHHKVRATGCLLKDVFIKNAKFINPTDYLYFTDDDVWASKWSNKCNDILSNLKKRNIPKRALVISSRTIEDGVENLKNIMNLEGDIVFLNKIIKVITEKYKIEYNDDITGKIWIDIPKTPKFKEAITCVIKNFSANTPFLTLAEVFPIDEWVKAFTQNKWNAFVFTMPEYCKNVSNISKSIFEELFDIKFNEYAQSICKFNEQGINIL